MKGTKFQRGDVLLSGHDLYVVVNVNEDCDYILCRLGIYLPYIVSSDINLSDEKQRIIDRKNYINLTQYGEDYINRSFILITDSMFSDSVTKLIKLHKDFILNNA